MGKSNRSLLLVCDPITDASITVAGPCNSDNIWSVISIRNANCGLDVSERFLELGRERLGSVLIKAKKPQLDPIGEKVLQEVAAFEADFIISNAVIQHVPPEEVNIVLGKIMGLATPRALILIKAKIAEVLFRGSWQTWAYPRNFLEEKLNALGATISEALRTKHLSAIRKKESGIHG